jgi:predicted RNase H-like nuclease
MYPHAFHVAAFGLAERILYKKGRRAVRLAGFALYQQHLRRLLDSHAPGLADAAAIAPLLEPGALEARGRALKALEDQLDAITCAVAALIAWRHGVAPGEVFGDSASGYIAVPGMWLNPNFVAPKGSG